jgi:hypothetical protein
MKNIDKILEQWYKIQNDLGKVADQFKDEHWESLIISHLTTKEDMSDELFYFCVEELDRTFDKLHLQYNIMNVFELEEDELSKQEDVSIELLYSMMTKNCASIVLFNIMEKYEYSKVLYEKLGDLFILVHCGHSTENEQSPTQLRKEFKSKFNITLDTIKATPHFVDYDEQINK